MICIGMPWWVQGKQLHKPSFPSSILVMCGFLSCRSYLLPWFKRVSIQWCSRHPSHTFLLLMHLDWFLDQIVTNHTLCQCKPLGTHRLQAALSKCQKNAVILTSQTDSKIYFHPTWLYKFWFQNSHIQRDTSKFYLANYLPNCPI